MRENADLTDEILIVDDGSDDQTPWMLSDISSRDSKIKVIQTNGIGLVGALNLGFRQSLGTWVARYDADDRYPANRIKRQRQLIGDDVATIFSDYSLWLMGEQYAGFIPSPIFHEAVVISLLTSQQTAHPSALINKQFFNLANGYLESDYPAEDLGLWIRLSKFGKLISVPEELLYYSLSPQGISSTNRELIQAKTLNFRKILIGQLLDNFDFSKLGIIHKKYDGISHGIERKILFLRNIYILKKIMREQGVRVRKFGSPNLYLYIFMHIPKVIKLFYYQNKRKNFRKYN